MLTAFAPLLVALAALATPRASLPAAAMPAAALTRLTAAYEARSLDGIDGVLTADFHWHFSSDARAGSGYVHGWGRDKELSFAQHLFTGNLEMGRPAADSIAMTTGPVEVGVDPEHPDSTCQYRVAIAPRFGMRVVLPDGRVTTVPPSLEIFHVVRGDAAIRMPGQSADTTLWYVRRWMEDLDAISVSLAAVEGECSGGPAAESTPASPLPTLGLRAIGVPLCPMLKVLCDLPGSEPAYLEVYDLQGTRVSQRTLSPGVAGSRLIEAGNGKRFTPGAYWVRLSQGRRAPVTRMVMVAR